MNILDEKNVLCSEFQGIVGHTGFRKLVQDYLYENTIMDDNDLQSILRDGYKGIIQRDDLELFDSLWDVLEGSEKDVRELIGEWETACTLTKKDVIKGLEQMVDCAKEREDEHDLGILHYCLKVI